MIETEERLCQLHRSKALYMCLTAECQDDPLMCEECLRQGHSHNTLYNIPDVCTLLSIKHKEKATMLGSADSDAIPIESLIMAQKKMVQQDQNKLIETIMKTLADEKKSLFEELEVPEKVHLDKYKHLARRLQTYRYLRDLQGQTLMLKLYMASQSGLADLRSRYFELDKITDEDYKALKDLKIVRGNLQTKLREKTDSSYISKFREVIKMRLSQSKVPLQQAQPNPQPTPQPALAKRNSSNDKSRRLIFDRKKSADEVLPSLRARAK